MTAAEGDAKGNGLDVAIEAAVGELTIDIEFAVLPGSCLALAGPSGAGKTSVLRAVAGLLDGVRGRIECGGRTWLSSDRNVNVPVDQRRCGLVFQDYALFDHMSTWRNVAFGMSHVARRQRKSEAIALLERFELDGLVDVSPAVLSGGERQRVALARALAHRPEALLLDEPLAALDVRTRGRATRELVGVLRELGIPGVLVSHDFLDAALVGDRIGVLDAGRLVQVDSVDTLCAKPGTAFVADFTGSNVLRGSARSRPDGLTDVALNGGGVVTSVEAATGDVAVAVHPWEIVIEPGLGDAEGSAQNHLSAHVTSVTTIGNRVRVGLATPQPLVAEVTPAAIGQMHLTEGASVIATWKASATRLLPL